MNRIRYPHATQTIDSLKEFWSEIASQVIDWMKPWDSVLEGSFEEGKIVWFKGGQLNASVNCLDRHLTTKAKHPALIWVADDETQHRTLTFAELFEEVNRMSNVLRQLSIKKGDKVAIYLPMIPESVIAMLACARIGAVHTVVFAGFSAHALRQRITASECSCIITADGMQRGGKVFSLKERVDEAINDLSIKTLLIKNTHTPVSYNSQRDLWWHEAKTEVPSFCEPEIMDAEDPLFILYTSGSTGQPKGIVHTTGGYLVQSAYTHQLIFDCKDKDIYWCTADIGWITGHSYGVYGPLCNGGTTLMDSGVPTWPDAARNWRIIDNFHVNVLYTSPTAIRLLKQMGDSWLKTSTRDSLRLLGTVGEPINPEAWFWFHEQVGKKNCRIMDTWWQTETGSVLISPSFEDTDTKPGAARHPIPGIVPVLLDNNWNEIHGAGEGKLAIKYPWPSIARTIAGDHQRYCSTYFHNGYYITGDGAKRDDDGDYWITGRIDDVINVSGHRLGTAEIESALALHSKVAEAAVVGMHHELKGQGVFAFVSLKNGLQGSPELDNELIQIVAQEISPIAKPDMIRYVNELPKTRSGKIMRRILRKIACDEVNSIDALGDLSTLANPEVVEALLKKP